MQGKKPSYEERKILEENGYDTYKWLIQKNTPDRIQIIHRETKEVQIIYK